MTVQEILDALSDYGFTDTTTIRKLEKINAAVWDICAREPWPFMETSVDLTFDGISATPSNSLTSPGIVPATTLAPGLPVDFQSVLDIVRLDTGTKLQPLRLAEADETMALQLVTVGTPVYYYFIGQQLRVAQIPASGTTMRMRYIRKQAKLLQTDVESAILIPPEHHEVALYSALVKLYDLEDDTELSVRFQQLFENALQNMRSSVWMRQYDRPDHIHIINADDYDYYT